MRQVLGVRLRNRDRPFPVEGAQVILTDKVAFSSVPLPPNRTGDCFLETELGVTLVRVELQTETQILVNEDRKMKKGLILAVAILILLALAARAQESRREVSAQGTVFFAKHSSGQGVSRETPVSPSVGS